MLLIVGAAAAGPDSSLRWCRTTRASGPRWRRSTVVPLVFPSHRQPPLSHGVRHRAMLTFKGNRLEQQPALQRRSHVVQLRHGTLVSVAILEHVTVLASTWAVYRVAMLSTSRSLPHVFLVTGVNNNAAVIVWADRGKPDQEHPTPTSTCSRDRASATFAERGQ